MTSNRVIDCCQTIVEPQDLWISRLPSQFKGRGPRVESALRGGQAWIIEDGATVLPLAHLLLIDGPSPTSTLLTNSYETMRPGCYAAGERVRDMDLDGIDVGVIFPTIGSHLHYIGDPSLHRACVQAYNDGLLDWCRQGDARRLVPVAVMPILDAQEAAAEAGRVAGLGYKAVLFTGWPNGSAAPKEEDDAFWRVCEEAGLVVCFNGPAEVRQPTPAGAEPRVLPRTPTPTRVNNMGAGLGAAQVVGRLVLRGVTERFAQLKLCFAGTGASWLPYFIEQMDGMHWHNRFFGNYPILKMLPSEYIKRNTKVTFLEDANAIKNLDDIGVERLLWSSLYPLEVCHWPNSKEVLKAQLSDLMEGERQQIATDNAAAYFGL